MLPDPTRLEEGKLLGLQLLGLQDTLDLQLLGLQDILDATAAPSQPQQLSSSIVPWWSIKLTSNPWAMPIFWAALVTNIHNFHFLLYNLELAGIRQKNPAGNWPKLQR